MQLKMSIFHTRSKPLRDSPLTGWEMGNEYITYPHSSFLTSFIHAIIFRIINTHIQKHLNNLNPNLIRNFSLFLLKGLKTFARNYYLIIIFLLKNNFFDFFYKKKIKQSKNLTSHSKKNTHKIKGKFHKIENEMISGMQSRWTSQCTISDKAGKEGY